MLKIALIEKSSFYKPIDSSEFNFKQYDTEIDDIRSVLFDICQILNQSEKIIFYVSGFGQLHWPVDISTDLVTIIEQFPDLLQWLDSESQNPFVLDFYEQGLERRLIFNNDTTTVKIFCESDSGWQPNPSMEICNKTELEKQTSEFITSFVLNAKDLCPQITSSELFQEWCHQETIYRRLNFTGQNII